MKILLFANVGTDAHGYYHVGDEAMFLESVGFYERYFPRASLSALVSEPFHRKNKVIEQKGPGWPDNLPHARQYFLTWTFKTWVWANFQIALFTPEQAKFVQYVQSHDLVHFTGGGNLTSECEHWFYYALFVIVVAHLLHKPVILSSQTIGPFYNWIDRWIARSVLNCVQRITIREGGKSDRLFRLGIDRSKIHYSVDSAYFLPSGNQKNLTKFQRAKKKFRVGLSLHERGDNTAQLEFVVTNIIKEIHSKHPNLEIVLIPHILNNRNEWDIQTMKKIIQHLPNRVTVITPTFTQLQSLKIELAHVTKALTGTCDLMICSRYHGVIFALSEHVPCIAVVDGEYQYTKNYEALKFIFGKQASKYLIKIDESPVQLERLQHLVRRVIDSRQHIRRIIIQQNKQLKARHHNEWQQLAKEITTLLTLEGK